jgi:hypothetical protein
VPVVEVPTSEITDWQSFHDVFAAALGFPGFYGRNGSAWIDCVTSADAPEEGMTAVHAAPGDVLVLRFDEHDGAFAARAPEQHAELHRWVAFVNWRRLDVGERAIVCIAAA